MGDYARRLAGECIRQGHPSVILSLNDTQISRPTEDFQDSQGTAVAVLRLPSVLSWSARVIKAGSWVNTFDPDWTSLQFVPFGFHPRGFCLGLGKRLLTICPRKKWHVMFHELWLGLGRRASAKYHIWGAVQRMTVRKLIRRVNPEVQHTQAEPYRKVLAKEGIQAHRLPLFSNIPCVEGDGWGQILGPLIAQGSGKPQHRQTLYLAGVFGAVHPEWDAEQTVAMLLPLVRRFRKQLALLFIGKNNLSPEAFASLKSRLRNRAVVIATGERTSLEVSQMLQTLDLGLATTPRQLIQKSGAAAAMLEHGLQILATRDDWQLQSGPELEDTAWLLTPQRIATLDILPSRKCEPPVEIRIEAVTAKLLRDLGAGSSPP